MALRKRINEISQTRIRYGYLRIHTLLVREGWHINRKKALIQELSGQEGAGNLHR